MNKGIIALVVVGGLAAAGAGGHFFVQKLALDTAKDVLANMDAGIAKGSPGGKLTYRDVAASFYTKTMTVQGIEIHLPEHNSVIHIQSAALKGDGEKLEMGNLRDISEKTDGETKSEVKSVSVRNLIYSTAKPEDFTSKDREGKIRTFLSTLNVESLVVGNIKIAPETGNGEIGTIGRFRVENAVDGLVGKITLDDGHFVRKKDIVDYKNVVFENLNLRQIAEIKDGEVKKFFRTFNLGKGSLTALQIKKPGEKGHLETASLTIDGVKEGFVENLDLKDFSIDFGDDAGTEIKNFSIKKFTFGDMLQRDFFPVRNEEKIRAYFSSLNLESFVISGIRASGGSKKDVTFNLADIRLENAVDGQIGNFALKDFKLAGKADELKEGDFQIAGISFKDLDLSTLDDVKKEDLVTFFKTLSLGNFTIEGIKADLQGLKAGEFDGKLNMNWDLYKVDGVEKGMVNHVVMNGFDAAFNSKANGMNFGAGFGKGEARDVNYGDSLEKSIAAFKAAKQGIRPDDFMKYANFDLYESYISDFYVKALGSTFSIKRYGIDDIQRDGKVVTNVHFEIKELNVPHAVFKQAPPQLAAFLDQLNKKNYIANLDVVANYDVASETMKIGPLNVDIDGLGKLKFESQFNGMDIKAARQMADGNFEAAQTFVPKLVNASLEYNDGVLANQIFKTMVGGQMEHMTALADKFAFDAAQFAGSDRARAQMIYDAVRNFIIGSNGFNINLAPTTPVQIDQLPGMVMADGGLAALNAKVSGN